MSNITATLDPRSDGMRDHNDHLDLLRGMAALLVLSGHLRAYLFVNHGALAERGLLTDLFYGATSLGHEAVMVFFALSGYLVGGAALAAMREGTWSWPRYALRRGTRLWIVVVPALIATLVFDKIGIALTGGAGYDGAYYATYMSGPAADAPADHSVVTFFGNLAFLQTIAVPVFGSNGPIWSLANEFWYYVLFPLAAAAVLVPQSGAARIASLALFAVLIAILPFELLAGGTIWLAGAAAAWLSARPGSRAVFAHNLARVALPALAAIVLILAKRGDLGGRGDLALGIAVAAALPVIAALPGFGALYRGVARASAAISYTLYLTHFPLLSLIVLGWIAPARFQPGLASMGLYVALLSAALIWAAIMWWGFERNTDRLYRALARRFLPRAANAAIG